MAGNLPQYPPFDIAGPAVGQRWGKWLLRFERLLIIAKVTDPTDKRAWLLHYAGEKVNDIFGTLPDTGNDADFDKAKEKLNSYFKPKVNVDFEVIKFRECEQKEEESIDDFCTRLRELAANCLFQDVEREIKTQIIGKCKSQKLRLKALSEPLTLDQLLHAGRSQELSMKQAKEIERTASGENAVKRIQTQSNKRYQGKKETCHNCGGTYPHAGKCPAKGVTCHVCGKSNHFAKVCQSGDKSKTPEHSKHYGRKRYGKKQDSKKQSIQQIDQSDSDDDPYAWSIHQVNTMKKPKVLVTINGSQIKVLIDTGASINLIDSKTYHQLKPRPSLNKDENPVHPYAGSPLDILGTFKAEIMGNEKRASGIIHVANKGRGNLLGYEMAVKLGYVQEIKGINEIITPMQDQYTKLCEEYDDRFNGIGKLKDVEIKLHIDDSYRPVQNRNRRIPYHIREKVQDELERLKTLDVILRR